MTRTITLNSQGAVLDDQLKLVTTERPFELLISVDQIDELTSTMEVLFDRMTVERIKQARANHQF